MGEVVLLPGVSRALGAAEQDRLARLLDDLVATVNCHLAEGATVNDAVNAAANLTGQLLAQGTDDPVAHAATLAARFPEMVLRMRDDDAGVGGSEGVDGPDMPDHDGRGVAHRVDPRVMPGDEGKL